MGKHKFHIERKNALINLLKDGERFLEFKINDNIQDIFEQVGQPASIIGNKEMGFYEYENGVRIGYIDDFMDEFVVMFSEKPHVKFSIRQSSTKDVKKITKELKIFQLINILNYNKIKWKSCDEKSVSVFTIITEGEILVLFDLETGKLFRFVYSSISKAIARGIRW